MKRTKFAVIALLITFLSTSFKPSAELKWVNFNEGYALAKKKNKIMLVDVYTEWCGWCKRMDRDTYAKDEIIELLSNDFVAIKFNPEVTDVTYQYEGKKYDGQELARVISNEQLNGYPTTIFLQPKYRKSNVLSGYYDANRFKDVITAVKQEFTKKPSKSKS